MDRSKVRLIVSGIVAVVGIALPETDWFGPDVARLIVLVSLILLVVLAGPVVWAWAQARLPALPVTLRSPVVRRTPTAPELSGELGFADFEAAAELAIQGISQTVTRMNKDMAKSARQIRSYTPRFAASADASGATKVRLGRQLASKMTPYAERMATNEALLRVNAHDLRENYLKRLPTLGDDYAIAQRRSIEGLRDVATEARQAMVGYRQGVQGSRDAKFQQQLNALWDGVLATTDRLIEDLDFIVAFATQVLREIAKRERRIRQSSSAAISSQDQT